MRAVRYRRGETGVRCEDVPVPEPAAGEVLVRVEAAGLCGTDVSIAYGGAERGLHLRAECGQRPTATRRHADLPVLRTASVRAAAEWRGHRGAWCARLFHHPIAS